MYGYGEFNQGQFFNYKRKEKELQEEISDLEKKLTGSCDARKFVKNWLDKLKMAWLAKNIGKIEVLFLSISQYFETPFEQPKTNVKEVMALWEEIQDQTIVSLGFKILVLEISRQAIIAVIEWNLELVNPSKTFSGVYEIKFMNQECVYFKQWTQMQY